VVDADLLAGVVGCAVVDGRLQTRGTERGAAGAASHSFAVVLHEAVREAPAVRGREATQFVDRTGGWVMALPGLHEVLVRLTLLPRPCLRR
jgi:hypothetical protein